MHGAILPVQELNMDTSLFFKFSSIWEAKVEGFIQRKS